MLEILQKLQKEILARANQMFFCGHIFIGRCDEDIESLWAQDRFNTCCNLGIEGVMELSDKQSHSVGCLSASELLCKSVGAVIKLLSGSFDGGKGLSINSSFACECARGGLDTDACKCCNIFKRDARGMCHV